MKFKYNYTYKLIMTNNRKLSSYFEIVEFHNKKGQNERLFDEMNYDFIQTKLPFSFLRENTAFLVMMSICQNLFHFLTNYIAKPVCFIKEDISTSPKIIV